MEDALVRTIFLSCNIKNLSLNPCFNGRCTSTSPTTEKNGTLATVLILVLMEDALVRTAERRSVFLKHVLILVLMEDALVPSHISNPEKDVKKSLNPCFNGRCTST